MRLLVVTATLAEIAPILPSLRHGSEVDPRTTRYEGLGHDLTVLVTGVGMVATSAWSSRVLARRQFDLVLNLGVCGSFRTSLAPGTVVHVVSDCIADLGAEDGDGFLTIQQLELLGEDEPPFTGGRLVNASPPRSTALAALPAVAGITVNTAHGSQRSIECVRARFDPDVESMEGAAFVYACLIHGVPFAQLRSVSNIVERRNRAAWKLPDAIDSLGAAARRLLQDL